MNGTVGGADVGEHDQPGDAREVLEACYEVLRTAARRQVSAGVSEVSSGKNLVGTTYRDVGVHEETPPVSKTGEVEEAPGATQEALGSLYRKSSARRSAATSAAAPTASKEGVGHP